MTVLDWILLCMEIRKSVFRRPYQHGCRGGKNKIRLISTRISSLDDWEANLNRYNITHHVNSGVHRDLLVNITKGNYCFSDKHLKKLAIVNTCSLCTKQY